MNITQALSRHDSFLDYARKTYLEAIIESRAKQLALNPVVRFNLAIDKGLANKLAELR